jgi:AcrR family transcriptional regulator
MSSATPSRAAARRGGDTHGRSDEVLRAALRVFAAKGYRAATIDDITRELGFTRAALYYYTKSKYELLTRVVFAPVEFLLQEVERVRALDADPATKLSEIMRGHIRLLIEHREWFMVMIREQMELAPVDAAQLQDNNRRYREALTEILRDGEGAGLFQPQSASVVALAIAGMINWMLQWYQEGGELSGEQIADVLVSLVLGGIQQPAQHASGRRRLLSGDG